MSIRFSARTASAAFCLFATLTFGAARLAASELQDPKPPTGAFSSGPGITLPYLTEGDLVLSAFGENKSSGSEGSRRTIATGVSRIADLNEFTGQFLFQTADNGVLEGPEHVHTWIGNTAGHVRHLLSGAGYVKLSAGGHYVAATDSAGKLKLIDLNGRVRAELGYGTSAVFSSDGSKLAFFRAVPYSVGSGQGIIVYDLASGARVTTYVPNNAELFPIAFADDGSTVFFVANAKLRAHRFNPLDPNRVDMFALTLRGDARRITRGPKKLPYLDYRRAIFRSGRLLLNAENTLWIVGASSGAISSVADVVDVVPTSDGVFIARSAGAPQVSWASLDISAFPK